LDAAVESELLRISANFWIQHLNGEPFVVCSGILKRCLELDGQSGQFRPAHLFAYMLAGLVYIRKALVGQWAIPTSERVWMENLRERCAHIRNTWLCKAIYSPVGYILSLLFYGRNIAPEIGSRLTLLCYGPKLFSSDDNLYN
jgi:hypothetical protein